MCVARASINRLWASVAISVAGVIGCTDANLDAVATRAGAKSPVGPGTDLAVSGARTGQVAGFDLFEVTYGFVAQLATVFPFDDNRAYASLGGLIATGVAGRRTSRVRTPLGVHAINRAVISVARNTWHGLL